MKFLTFDWYVNIVYACNKFIPMDPYSMKSTLERLWSIGLDCSCE